MVYLNGEPSDGGGELWIMVQHDELEIDYEERGKILACPDHPLEQANHTRQPSTGVEEDEVKADHSGHS